MKSKTEMQKLMDESHKLFYPNSRPQSKTIMLSRHHLRLALWKEAQQYKELRPNYSWKQIYDLIFKHSDVIITRFSRQGRKFQPYYKDWMSFSSAMNKIKKEFEKCV